MNEMNEVKRIWIKPQNSTPQYSGRIELSPIDVAMPLCYIPFAWYWKTFDETLISRLEKTLFELVNNSSYFKPLSGSLHQAGSFISFGNSEDQGVLFVVQKSTSPINDFYKLGSNTAIFEIPDNSSVEVSPVLASKITTFPNNSGISIAISLNHRVGDADMLTNFAHQWFLLASLNQTQQKPLALTPSYSRDFILTEFQSSHSTPSTTTEETSTTTTTTTKSNDSEMNNNSTLLKDSLVIEEIFTKQELFQLKKLASAFLPSGENEKEQRFITTKDALLAHIWKCLVLSNPQSQFNTSTFGISLACNLRKRFGIQQQTSSCPYYGNCVIVCTPKKNNVGLTYQQILNGNLRALSLFIRENVVENSQKAPLDELVLGMGSIMTNYRIGIDVTSSDWTNANFYTNCRLDGKCADIVVPVITGHPMPGLVNFIQNGSDENDGIKAYIHVTASQNEYIKKSGILHNFN